MMGLFVELEAAGMNNRGLDASGLPEGYPFRAELEISPRETAQRLRTGDGFVLIDVREDKELRAARVEGAVHIPLGDLPRRIHELELDELTPFAVMCHGGVRSMKATLYLHQEGLRGARSVAGGIDLWSVAVDPSVPRY